MKRFPKSIRKYLRKEKARLRREITDLTKQELFINELLERLKKQYNKNIN